MRYYLINRVPVKANDLSEWVKWFENANRHVANDVIDDVRISTVFLGIDHAFGASKPILFETMIFRGPLDGYQERYHTYEEAEQGHEDALNRARNCKR